MEFDPDLEERSLDVEIPPGIHDGQRIRLSGEGHIGSPGAPAGDVYVRVRVKPDARFVREGDDIYSTLDLTIAEAALKNAAGGGGGGGGFAALTRYLDRLASFLIPVGAAASVLGLISGGVMFMFGNPAATKVLGYVALGVVIVLASKGLAA